MRRRDKQQSEAEAWALLAGVPVMHLAALLADGTPVIRALHGVVHDGGIVFHGAHKGEKAAVVGGPAVVTGERIVAEIPSHVTHAERACPATTFFRSAMVHGALVDVREPGAKAAALQALMERFQPGGGYRPISAADPLYTKAVRGVAVWKLVPERVSAKAALGQGKTDAWKRRALLTLWQRGDCRGLRELAREWGLSPWQAPAGATVILPGDEHVADAVELLRDQYWNARVTDAQLTRAQGGIWVGAVDDTGRLVATARALSDGGKFAYLMDVAVAPGWQGRGLGRAVMTVLLDHAQVRDCPHLGFEEVTPPSGRRVYKLSND